LVVVLNLDLTEEPVGGTLAQRQHADRSFSGWFELIGFLEDAVRVARHPDGVDTPDGSTPLKNTPSTGHLEQELKAT
jgi:hypothetical protein